MAAGTGIHGAWYKNRGGTYKVQVSMTLDRAQLLVSEDVDEAQETAELVIEEIRKQAALAYDDRAQTEGTE